MSPTRPKFPFVYILRKYVREIPPTKGILGLVGWWAYFYTNFYETHSSLHFNQKCKSEFKLVIPDAGTDCIHVTIIFNQYCVVVILMQEIFGKGKGN